jgi:hypothetical protein
VTPTDEATFITLWRQCRSTAEIAQVLGIPRGTVATPAQRLVPRERSQRDRGAPIRNRSTRCGHRRPSGGGPSTVHPETWELKQLEYPLR